MDFQSDGRSFARDENSESSLVAVAAEAVVVVERYKHYIPDEVIGYQVENLKGLENVKNPLVKNAAAAVSVFVNKLSERGQICVDVEEVRRCPDGHGWRMCIFGENKITASQMSAIEAAFPESAVTVDPNLKSITVNRARELVTGAIVVELPRFPMPSHLLLPPPPPPPPQPRQNTARPNIRRAAAVAAAAASSTSSDRFDSRLSRVQAGGIKKHHNLRDKRTLTRRLFDFALGIDTSNI